MKFSELFNRVTLAAGLGKLLSAVMPHLAYYKIPMAGPKITHYIPKCGLSIFTGKPHVGKKSLVWRLIEYIMNSHQLTSETVIALAEWNSQTYITSAFAQRDARAVHGHLSNLDDLIMQISIIRIDSNVRIVLLEELPLFSFYPQPGDHREQRVCDLLHQINSIGVKMGVAIFATMTDTTNANYVDPAKIVLTDSGLGRRPMLPVFESSLRPAPVGDDDYPIIEVLRHPLNSVSRSHPQVSYSK